MAVMRYWTGTTWELVSTGSGGGGGGGVGPPGPAGADGQSVEVFGPQTPQPTPTRKGDVWIQEFARAVPIEQSDSVPQQIVTIVGLVQPEPIKIVYLN